jgi:hypothetical protein
MPVQDQLDVESNECGPEPGDEGRIRQVAHGPSECALDVPSVDDDAVYPGQEIKRTAAAATVAATLRPAAGHSGPAWQRRQVLDDQ